MNFSKITGISIGNKDVVKIESGNKVLWRKGEISGKRLYVTWTQGSTVMNAPASINLNGALGSVSGLKSGDILKAYFDEGRTQIASNATWQFDKSGVPDLYPFHWDNLQAYSPGESCGMDTTGLYLFTFSYPGSGGIRVDSCLSSGYFAQIRATFESKLGSKYSDRNTWNAIYVMQALCAKSTNPIGESSKIVIYTIISRS